MNVISGSSILASGIEEKMRFTGLIIWSLVVLAVGCAMQKWC
jgi:hypothetical protein